MPQDLLDKAECVVIFPSVSHSPSSSFGGEQPINVVSGVGARNCVARWPATPEADRFHLPVSLRDSWPGGKHEVPLKGKQGVPLRRP